MQKVWKGLTVIVTIGALTAVGSGAVYAAFLAEEAGPLHSKQEQSSEVSTTPKLGGIRSGVTPYEDPIVKMSFTSPALNSNVASENQVFTGKGYPGAKLVLKTIDDLVLYEGMVEPDGTWSAKVPKMALGIIRINVVNYVNNKSYTLTPEWFNVVKVYKNSLNTPAKGATTITGTANPYATVIVYAQDGTKISEARATVDGDWSLKAPASTGTYYPTYNGTRGDDFSYKAADREFVVASPAVGSDLSPKSQVFSGTGTPGSTYVLKNAAGTQLHSGTVAANGSWSATLTGLAEGTLKLTVVNTIDGTVKTVDGGQFTVLKDHKNSLNTPAKGATTITGTGIPGETVAILSASGSKVSEVKVAADGSWSLKAPTSTGTYYPTYNGTRGDDFSYKAADREFVVASPAVGSDLSPKSQVFSGTGTPGSTYVLKNAAGTQLHSGTVAANGSWSATLTGLAEGTLKLTVVNTIDGTVKTVDGGQFTVLKDHKNSLNTPAKGATTITGTGIPGETVAILSASGSKVSEVKVAADGSWSLKAPTSTGTYYPTYNGTRGDNFSYTEADPVLTFEHLTPKVGSDISESDQTFTGRGTPGATYSLRDSRNVVLARGTVSGNGNWSATATTLPVGTLKLTVLMTLSGATQSYEVGNFTVLKDHKNSLNTPAKGATTITGTGTPGETVAILSASGSKVSEVKVAADGSWSLKAPTSTGTYYPTYNGTRGDDFSYTAADAAFVLDTPSKGSTLNAKDQVFAGTGEPGSTYELTNASGTVLHRGTVASNGNWYAKVASLPEGSLKLTMLNTIDGKTSSIDGGSFTVRAAYKNSLNTPAKGATTITGTGTPGETVAILSASGSKVSEVKVAADGSWSLKAPTSTGTYYPTYNGTRGDNFTYTEADPVLTFEHLTPKVGSDISESDQTFTGRGTPGATYSLRDSRNVVLARGTVSGNGNWSATATTLPVGTLKLTVLMTLSGATQSYEVGNFTVLKDHKNSLNTPAKGATTITGTGTPGETVAILSASGSKVSEVKVAADGSWSLKAPTSTGTYYPTYNGTRGDNFTYTEADPVLAFELLTPQAGSTLSELKQAFTGTGTPGAEYTLRDGRNVIVASGTIPASGTWSVTADDLPVGALTLTAQMTLRGETHTEGLGSFTVAKDYPNSLNTPAKGDESITGTGTPGEIVSLHAANGSKVSESTVAPDGSWSLTAPAESGSYYPSYGGERGEDFGYEVADPVYEFGLLTPSAGSEISMENQEFTGTATPGSTVVLKDGNGNVLYEGKADEAGNWSGTVPKLPEGPLHLTIDNTLEGVTTTIDGGEFLAVAEGNGEDTPVLSPAIAGGYGLLLAAGTALGLRRNRSSKG